MPSLRSVNPLEKGLLTSVLLKKCEMIVFFIRMTNNGIGPCFDPLFLFKRLQKLVDP